MMKIMMDTTMVVVSLSVTVLAVTWSVLYLTDSGPDSAASKLSPTTFYQEEDEKPPKTISVEDSPTVQTTDSDESSENNSTADEDEVEEDAEEDKTLITGSVTRECAKIEEEPATSVGGNATPLPKKMRRAARKMLGIRKPAKVPTSPSEALAPKELRVANDMFV